MGADQELNAERLTALSAGITLDPLTVTSAEVHGSALRTLASDSLRTGAKRVRDEIEKMPSPASIVADLELIMGNVNRR